MTTGLTTSGDSSLYKGVVMGLMQAIRSNAVKVE